MNRIRSAIDASLLRHGESYQHRKVTNASAILYNCRPWQTTGPALPATSHWAPWMAGAPAEHEIDSSPGRENHPLTHPDTAVVRPGEEINLAALGDYLRGKIEGAERGIAVEQF